MNTLKYNIKGILEHFLIKNGLCSLLSVLIFLSYRCLSASIVDPNVANQMPGWKDFNQACQYFKESKLDEAASYFNRAIENSYKPYFDYGNFVQDNDNFPCCSDFYFRLLDIENYPLGCFYLRCPEDEIKWAIYRYSHFHLGLIHLRQHAFLKAHCHFQEAIGFGNDEIGSLYFRCMNIMDPFWILCASLTSLHIGQIELAEELINLAYNIDCEIPVFVGLELESKWIGLYEEPDYKDCIKDLMPILDEAKVSINQLWSLVYRAKREFKLAISLASSAIQEEEIFQWRWHLGKERTLHESALYLHRGALYDETGHYQKALLDYTRAIDLAPLSADAYLRRGTSYLALENYSQAITDFSKVIELDPLHLDCYRYRALAHFLNHSLDQANLDLKAIQILKNQPLFKQIDLGLLCFSKGEFQKSIEHFNEFIKAHPAYVVGYQNRGAAYLQMSLIDQSIEDFNQALLLTPHQGQLYEMRGLAYLSRSDFEQAEKDLLKATQLNSDSTIAFLNLAAAYYMMGKVDEALNLYQKVVKLNSEKDFSRVYHHLAMIYFEKKNYHQAWEYYNQAIHLGKPQAQLYLMRGLCLYEKGQFEEAIRDYDVAIELECVNSNSYFNRGQAYYRLGKLEQACEDFTKAIQLDSAQSDLYKWRGLVFLNLNQRSEAYADFFNALHVMNRSQTHKTLSDKIPLLDSTKTLIEFKKVRTSLDGKYLYSSSNLSKQTNSFVSQSLKRDCDQLDLDEFQKGLIKGLVETRKDSLNKLGPFLVHLALHPLLTTQEVVKGIRLLIAEIDGGDWKTIDGSLVPEIKELYVAFNQIDDQQKGFLTGKWIGKNDREALEKIQITQALAPLKETTLSGHINMMRCLKKNSAYIPDLLTPFKFSSPSGAIPVYPENSWLMPYPGGVVMGTQQFYPEQIFCIAPKPCPQVLAAIEEKILQKAEETGMSTYKKDLSFEKVKNEKELNEYLECRQIAPLLMEPHIANPGSQEIKVIFNDSEQVMRIEKLNQ